MNVDTVKTIPLFGPLAKREHARVAALADEVIVPAGLELTRQGGYAREFFVVVEGTAEVFRDGELVGALGPGDFFGEVGLLGAGWLRTAPVVATSPMRLLVAGRNEFRTLITTLPAVAEPIIAAAAMREA